MKKLFVRILALYIALLPLVPSVAEAAAKFLVLCTTACTWDNTNDTIWSTSSGGLNNTTHPIAGDDVTLDASSCVGGTTCIVTTGAVTISAASIAWGAFTASTTGGIVKADTNNTNFTLTSGAGIQIFNGSGTGTRKWLAGIGTYTLTQNNAFNQIFNMSTTTNDQGSVFSGATWVAGGTASTSSRAWAGGGFSFGPTTFNASSSGGTIGITGANTWASITVNGPLMLVFPGSTTQTITGALTLTGSSSSAVAAITSNGVDTSATISLGSASTGTWASLRAITTSGAAGLIASNCFNLGFNTLANGGQCNGPSAGGGGGRIIGG